MADKKISQLTLATSVNLTDLLPLVQSGTTKRVTWSILQNNITKVGTVTTGIWNGSVITVAYGGTGSNTALANNRIMKSSGGAIVEHSAQTATYVAYYDANGLPTGSSAITYDGTTFTYGGSFFKVTNANSFFGGSGTPLTWVEIAGATTTQASLRLRAASVPGGAYQYQGSIWNDGTYTAFASGLRWQYDSTIYATTSVSSGSVVAFDITTGGTGYFQFNKYIVTKGATTNNTAYAFKAIDSSSSNLLSIRNDGEAIFNSTIDSGESWKFITSGADGVISVDASTYSLMQFKVGGTVRYFFESGVSNDYLKFSSISTFSIRNSSDVNFVTFDGTNERLGIKNESPLSSLDINGSIGLKVRRVATGETMSVSYTSYVLTNSAAADQTFTCPTLASSVNRMYLVKNQSQTYNMIIDGDGSEQFIPLGGVPVNDFTLAAGEACFIHNDGTYWNIL